MMYDDLKAWIMSVFQTITKVYTSEPVIAVVLTEMLFLIILYGPVDRKGLIGYIKEACRTIVGEVCHVIEQFIGESRSLSGFSGALHYIFFGKYDDKIKLTMVNYVAIFCSVITFFASWLALKEFLGYPCGLFLAFVLQIIFLLFAFNVGMLRKNEKESPEFCYIMSNENGENGDTKEIRENIIENNADIKTGAGKWIREKVNLMLKRPLGIIGLLICILINTFCTYSFIFEQYLADTIDYDTAESIYDTANEYCSEALKYKDNLRTYLLTYLNNVDEVIAHGTDGDENKEPIIPDNILNDIIKEEGIVRGYLDNYQIRTENIESDREAESKEAFANLQKMTDKLMERTGNTKNIFVIRDSDLEITRNNAIDEDFSYFFTNDMLFLDDSIKTAMYNYTVLDRADQLYETISFSQWMSDFQQDENEKRITTNIAERLEKLIALEPMGSIDGVRTDKDGKQERIVQVKAFDTSSVHDELKEYYLLINPELTITYRVIKSLRFIREMDRFKASLIFSFVLNVIFAAFCVARIRLPWSENPRKNKNLIKSLFLKEMQVNDAEKNPFRFRSAALGVTVGTLWSIYCSDGISVGKEINQLEKMLFGALVGISFALGLEAVIHQIVSFRERRRLQNRGESGNSGPLQQNQTGQNNQLLHFWSAYITEDANNFFSRCENVIVWNEASNKRKNRLYIETREINARASITQPTQNYLPIIHQLVDVKLAFPVYSGVDQSGSLQADNLTVNHQRNIEGYVFSRKLLVLLRQCICEQGGGMQDVPSGFMEDIRDHDEGA